MVKEQISVELDNFNDIDKYRQAIKNYIDSYDNPEKLTVSTPPSIFTVLKELSNTSSITSQDKIQLLTENLLLGHTIAHDKGERTLQIYLYLLIESLNTSGDAQSIFKSLQAQNKNDWMFGHVVLYNYYGETVQLYLYLLTKLQIKGIDAQNIYQLLQQETIDSWTQSSLIALHDAKTFLIFLELMPNKEEEICKYRNKKAVLFEYIKGLPNKKALLQDALDNNTRLGKLFWAQRWFTKPRIDRGYLRKIAEELNHRNNEPLKSSRDPNSPTPHP